MKRFLECSVGFLLPIFISAVFAEMAIRSVDNPYKYKYQWMQENAEEVEVLVLGSSHTFYGVRPEFLAGNAFSLANVSQDFTHDLYQLKYWANRYKHLKTVIVPISFFSWFSGGLENGSESYRCRFYKIYMDCDLYPDLSLYNLEISDYRSARRKLDKLLHEDNAPGVNSRGWGETYKLSSKKVEEWNNGSEADAAVKRHTAVNYDNVGKNYQQMKEIAEFCQQRNIQLVLITTPCWASYYENLNQEQLKKMYELTRRLQHEYQLLYLDYLKDARFVADDFYDSNHLSDVGAEKFTKILNQDIVSSSR